MKPSFAPLMEFQPPNAFRFAFRAWADRPTLVLVRKKEPNGPRRSMEAEAGEDCGALLQRAQAYCDARR